RRCGSRDGSWRGIGAGGGADWVTSFGRRRGRAGGGRRGLRTGQGGAPLPAKPLARGGGVAPRRAGHGQPHATLAAELVLRNVLGLTRGTDHMRLPSPFDVLRVPRRRQQAKGERSFCVRHPTTRRGGSPALGRLSVQRVQQLAMSL